MSKKNSDPRRWIDKNNCTKYEHQEGAPVPESQWSCRGCKNSFDPELYDAGCKLEGAPFYRKA